MADRPTVVLQIMRAPMGEDGEDDSVVVRMPLSIATKIVRWVPVCLRRLHIEPEGVELFGTIGELDEFYTARHEKMSLLPGLREQSHAAVGQDCKSQLLQS